MELNPFYFHVIYEKSHIFWDSVPGDENACEVVGPGQVEIDGMADNAEGDREERGHHDGPVLVRQQLLLHVQDVDISCALGIQTEP
jgi:hypothetical protein